jgi:ribonuclease P protein subunit RPR2
MTNIKVDGGAKRVPNRHIYARLSFLHQAAQHLANGQHVAEIGPQNPQDSQKLHITNAQEGVSTEEDRNKKVTPDSQSHGPSILNGGRGIPPTKETRPHASGLPRELAAHILSVSRKAKVKLSHEVKRSICRRCTSVLIPGQTAECTTENKSRGSRKAWADVLAVRCLSCGMEKRYAVGAQRVPKQKDRVLSIGRTAQKQSGDQPHGNL